MVRQRQNKRVSGLDLEVRKQLLESFRSLERMKIIPPIDRRALYSFSPDLTPNQSLSKLLSNRARKSPTKRHDDD